MTPNGWRTGATPAEAAPITWSKTPADWQVLVSRDWETAKGAGLTPAIRGTVDRSGLTLYIGVEAKGEWMSATVRPAERGSQGQMLPAVLTWGMHPTLAAKLAAVAPKISAETAALAERNRRLSAESGTPPEAPVGTWGGYHA